MYPGHWAKVSPDKVAVSIVETGAQRTFAELDSWSCRLANYWYDKGLRPGDHVAIFAENVLEYFDVYWASLRSGLYLTPINRYLQAEELAYILQDCKAQSLITTRALIDTAIAGLAGNETCAHNLVIGESSGELPSYAVVLQGCEDKPLADEPRGEVMVYSSGTTGRPKGIKRPLTGLTVAEEYKPHTPVLDLLKQDEHARMLVPAPLYHTAPLGHAVGNLARGGTVFVMQKFDPLGVLEVIERERLTHAYWVPTMFVRLLKLPERERVDYDVSSLKTSIHTAAPCPTEVKAQMLDWFGPTIYEYYGGSEFTGLTWADPHGWLEHPGSVGREMVGIVHICDDDGNEVSAGETGTIYFENDAVTVEYHNDPEQSASVRHPNHPTWTTLGDVGYLSEDRWLYLTDRKTFMIISGGVNIYPQEIEDCLIQHPKIEDVAVIGVPNNDLGEEVKAIIQKRAGERIAEEEVIAYARDKLAHYKCPRTVDFVDELPRLPTGKLYKKALREKYWEGHQRRIS